MARLPARRGARNITLVDPSREFEDIYDRMGQLMSMAFGDLAFTPALAVCPSPRPPSRVTSRSAVNRSLTGAIPVELGDTHRDRGGGHRP